MLLIIFLFFCNIAIAQNNDIHAIYTNSEGTQSSILFENYDSKFNLSDDRFQIQKDENGSLYSNLTISGDFNGDGIDESALFYDYLYIRMENQNIVGQKSLYSDNRINKFQQVEFGFRP